MATAVRQQPQWEQPQEPDLGAQLPPLKIWNSLTRSKVPFYPIDWKTKTITWYACGPTVYDDAHLGHARNYVTTDILRRILRDYFSFKIKFVMNITDIDDKIILRGRQQHLLSEYITRMQDSVHESDTRNAVNETSLAALQHYLLKNLSKISQIASPANIDKLTEESYGHVMRGESLTGGPPGDKEAKIKMHIKTARTASHAIVLLQDQAIQLNDFFPLAADIFLPYLDSLHGASIDGSNHAIFTKLTQNFEARFMEDVRALNCLDPDELTRVTEYGPQIVDFVKNIHHNGFAYKTSDGSVYFDIEAFEKAKNHYARLEPWNRNDKDLQADGEGALSKKTTEKKSDADFVLWKSSKPGEPSWLSPWGLGRPGWHIECSAMASETLGSKMDIHSGGIDLAFPHHDNELAQSEAFWQDQSHEHQHQWVNYFIHIGHLSIQGSKMSKSLKNFTTIREALSRGDWTPRGLRIVFLLGSWKDGIEITDDMVKAGSAWEDKVNNFFIKVNDILEIHPTQKSRNSPINDPNLARSSTSDAEGILEKAFRDTQTDIYSALCDSFNTSLVMAKIAELITRFNTADQMMIPQHLVRQISDWLTSMVNIFGLDGTAAPKPNQIGWSGVSIPDAAKPYVYSASRIRDSLRKTSKVAELTPEKIEELLKGEEELQIRHIGTDGERYAAIETKFKKDLNALISSTNLSKDVLSVCDRLRDVELWDHGIYLEDRDGAQPALVRPVTKEQLFARKEKEERDRQKQKAREEREKEAAAKADRGRQNHLEMFQTKDYTAWDEDGVPTKDEKGEEITKSKAKKLKKDWERQKKLHVEWLKTNA